jgi:hypothetical protein
LTVPRWQPNPGLDALADQEAREFARFMAGRDAGVRLPYRDKPKAGAMKIVSRERAVSNLEAGMLRHDRAAREKGVVSGSVLRAQVTDIRKEKVQPRLFEYEFVLSSKQDSLHLRSGDALWTLDDPTISLRIDHVERRGAITKVSGRVLQGKNAVKRLSPGITLDFGPRPNWQRIGHELGQMSERLTQEPWTHGDTMPPSTPVNRPMPSNLLAVVKASHDRALRSAGRSRWLLTSSPASEVCPQWCRSPPGAGKTGVAQRVALQAPPCSVSGAWSRPDQRTGLRSDAPARRQCAIATHPSFCQARLALPATWPVAQSGARA